MQEVFLKLVQVLPTFRYDAAKVFRRWLRTVTLNTWRDRAKRRGDRPPQVAGAVGVMGDGEFQGIEVQILAGPAASPVGNGAPAATGKAP